MKITKIVALIVCIIHSSLSGSFTPNDPRVSEQYYLDAVNVRAAWLLGYTGEGVVIGIVDTGISDHDDLTNLIFTPGDLGDGIITDSHGTSVAGVAAAVGGNNNGIAGIAPFASLASFDAGVPVDSIIGDGIDFAPDILYLGSGVNRLTNNYESEAVLGVRNNSYGFVADFSGNSEPRFEFTTRNNVIDVFAAGNSRDSTNPNSSTFGLATTEEGLNDPNLIVVSATNEQDVFADFSDFGSNIFVAAPGENILSTTGTTAPQAGTSLRQLSNEDIARPRANEFGEVDGTSFSAPIVSGVIALGKQANPDLHVRMAKHSLARTAVVVDAFDSSATGGWITNAAGFDFNNNYGFGLPDAEAFVLDVIDTTYVTAQTTRTVSSAVGANVFGDQDDFMINVTSQASDQSLESVLITLDTSSIPAFTEGKLVSPSGTTSVFLSPIETAYTETELWTFLSNAFWGESVAGDWTLSLTAPDGLSFTLNDFDIDFLMGEIVTEDGMQLIEDDVDALSVQIDKEDTHIRVDNGAIFTLKDGIRLNEGTFEVVDGFVFDDGFKGLLLEVNSGGEFILGSQGDVTATRGLVLDGANLENGGFLDLGGVFSLTNEATVMNDGDILLDDVDAVIDDSQLVNNQTFAVNGTLNIRNGSSVLNNDELLMSVNTIQASNGNSVNRLIISGGGTFTNAAGAVLDLAGDNIVVSGSEFINQGDISSASHITLSSGAQFTVGGPQNILIDGDYSQSSDSTLRVLTDTAGAGTITFSGEVKMNGTLVIDRLNSGNGPFSLSDTVSLFTAGDLEGEFDSVVWDPALLEHLTHSFEIAVGSGGAFTATAVRDFNNSQLTDSLTPVQRNVAEMLNSTTSPTTMLGATADIEIVLSEIDSLGSVSEIAHAFDNIAPYGVYAMRQLAFSSASSQVSNLRRYTRKQSELRQFRKELKHIIRMDAEIQPKSSSTAGRSDEYYEKLAQRMFSSNQDIYYDKLTQTYTFGARAVPGQRSDYDYVFDRKFNLGTFISGVFEIGDTQRIHSAPGSEFESYQITVGVDMPVGDNWLVGVLFGTSSGESESDFNGNTVESENFSVGAFASFQGDISLIDMAVNFSQLTFDTERNVNVGTLARKATASADGILVDAFMGGNINLIGGNSSSFGPIWSVHYRHLFIDEFRESGAGSLNYAIDESDSISLLLELGGNYHFTTGTGVGDFVLTLYGTFNMDPFYESDTINARLFSVPGAEQIRFDTGEPAQTSIRFGGNVGLKTTDLTSISLGYGYFRGLGGDRQESHSLSADFDYHF